MGKHKASRGQHSDPRASIKSRRKMGSFSRLSTHKKPRPKSQPKSQTKKDTRKGPLQGNQKPIIPFLPSDRILLVGEGDFSFALSLATNHGCKRILATSYDNHDTLFNKYPQAERNISQLCYSLEPGSSTRGVKRKLDGTLSSDHNSGSGEAPPTLSAEASPSKTSSKVLFSIDAKKLGLAGGGGKVVRSGFPRFQPRKDQQVRRYEVEKENHKDSDESGPWDIICFNFPHVGGLSTDVNRQVRANQELLVSFFKACVPLLSAPPPEHNVESSDEEASWDEGDEELYNNSGTQDSKFEKRRTDPGQIIVTLFEGEPYTLWNIRDLARHAGLKVTTSFKFPWTSYPGYSHARTLGEIEKKHGAGRGGWRGEDREARSYVFERKESRYGKKTLKRNNQGNNDRDKSESE